MTELPIFSFFISMLSILTGNDTASINSSVIIAQSDNISPIQRVAATVTRIRPTLPTVPTTTQPPDLSTFCPNQANSSDLGVLLRTRYHNKTKRCYTVPSQGGPCGDNMSYFAEDDIFGECGCKIDNRLLIYNKKKNACFYIFQQGYCSKTEWLDINRNGTPICTRNPCMSQRTSKKDIVKLRGKCVEVGKSASICPEGDVVGFDMFKRVPSCVYSRSLLTVPRSIGVPTTPCSLGSVMALDGRCNPPFDFD